MPSWTLDSIIILCVCMYIMYLSVYISTGQINDDYRESMMIIENKCMCDMLTLILQLNWEIRSGS